MFRELIKTLDESPLIDALLQVSLSVIFTLGFPFVIAWIVAVPNPQGELEVFSSFLRFFSSGELAFPIFAITGTCTYLMILGINKYGKLLSFLAILGVYVPTITIALILGSNDGTSLPLEERFVPVFWGFYLFICFVWVLILWFAEGGTSTTRLSADKEMKNAKDLAKEARR